MLRHLYRNTLRCTVFFEDIRVGRKVNPGTDFQGAGRCLGRAGDGFLDRDETGCLWTDKWLGRFSCGCSELFPGKRCQAVPPQKKPFLKSHGMKRTRKRPEPEGSGSVRRRRKALVRTCIGSRTPPSKCPHYGRRQQGVCPIRFSEIRRAPNPFPEEGPGFHRACTCCRNLRRAHTR